VGPWAWRTGGGASPATTARRRPRELGLWRAGHLVRPPRTRVSSMCARRRFRRAQTAMEVGGAMSSPRGGANGGRRSWAAVGRAREAEVGEATYSRGRSVVSGEVTLVTQARVERPRHGRRRASPRRPMARREWCAGPVDWRHLARPTCHERHGGVHVVAAQ
jgi:hypothetical protein